MEGKPCLTQTSTYWQPSTLLVPFTQRRTAHRRQCLTTRQPLWQRLTPYWRLVVCSGKYLWRCPAAAELWTLDSGAIMLNAKTTEETHLRALVRGRSALGGGAHYEGAIWDPDRYGYACRPGGGLSA